MRFIKENSYSRSNYWLNAILFNSHDEQQTFLEYSNSNGVITRPGWDLLNTLPMFSNQDVNSLENARKIQSLLVNLPSSVRK